LAHALAQCDEKLGKGSSYWPTLFSCFDTIVECGERREPDEWTGGRIPDHNI